MDWRELQPEERQRLRLAYVGRDHESSPVVQLLTAGLKEMGKEAQVVGFDVVNEELEECLLHLKSAGFKGVSIGNPHKPMAAKLAHKFFTVKHSMGVANALVLGDPIYAQNTEVGAFGRVLADIKPGTALVLGAGQGARSVLMGLFDAGWTIRLWNRNAMRARPMITLFERYGKIELVTEADPSGSQLVINATPMGAKAGEQPPVLWTRARPHTIALDLVFRYVATEFLRSASTRGFMTIDGRELLIEQLALALEWWTAKAVPRGAMRQSVGLKGSIHEAFLSGQGKTG